MDTSQAVSAAFGSFAPFYERWAHDYAHVRWLRRLEALARGHGLRGKRVLDVACGTGKSLRPLLAMGYEGAGCDISGAMLLEAKRLSPGVRLFEADMRNLPSGRPYSWITCMNDAINYLVEDRDLERALTSMAHALEPDGLVTFDVNTLSGHRAAFSSTCAVQHPDSAIFWQGLGSASTRREVGTAAVTIFEKRRSGWRRVTSQHHERWWAAHEIEAAARGAGLRVVARHGQRTGGIVEGHVDEERHNKVVYFLRPVAAPLAARSYGFQPPSS